MIGSATYIRIASNNETSKNNIPIDHIDSVEFSNRGLSSVAVVNYQMNGSGRSLLLQFPYSSPLESNREVETAKDIFEQMGVEIREKNPYAAILIVIKTNLYRSNTSRCSAR